MEIALFLIYLGLASLILWRIKAISFLSKSDLFIGLGVKIVFSISFIAVFTHYYGDGQLTGDAYEFMKDSRVLNQLAVNHPSDFLKLYFDFGTPDPEVIANALENTNIWTTSNNGDFVNDNRLIIRINILIHFVSGGSMYVHALFFSILSFIGVLFIFKTFEGVIQRKKLFYFFLIGFPSIGFWSGGITKESILVFAIGLFLFGGNKILKPSKSKRSHFIYLLIFLIGSVLLALNKPHVGLVLMAAYLLFIIGKRLNFNSTGRYVFLGISFIGFLLLCFAPRQYNLVDKVSYKQKDLINLGKGGVFFVTDSSFCRFDYSYYQHFKIQQDSIQVLKTTPGEYKLFGHSEFHDFEISKSPELFERYLVQAPSNSFIDTKVINYSKLALLTSVPNALINSLIRPFPTDPGSGFKYLAFFSNISILFLFILSVLKRKSLDDIESYWVVYLCVAILSISLIIGWTIPILGAIVRYKMAIDLLLIILIFILWKKKPKTLNS